MSPRDARFPSEDPLRNNGISSPFAPRKLRPDAAFAPTLIANRVGYLFLALAMALFVIAFAVGFNATMATLIAASMFVSFALLAPSIVLGYAVKAADRDDAEHGW